MTAGVHRGLVRIDHLGRHVHTMSPSRGFIEAVCYHPVQATATQVEEALVECVCGAGCSEPERRCDCVWEG